MQCMSLPQRCFRYWKITHSNTRAWLMHAFAVDVWQTVRNTNEKNSCIFCLEYVDCDNTTNPFCFESSNYNLWMIILIFNRTFAENYLKSIKSSLFEYYKVIKYGRAWWNLIILTWYMFKMLTRNNSWSVMKYMMLYASMLRLLTAMCRKSLVCTSYNMTS